MNFAGMKSLGKTLGVIQESKFREDPSCKQSRKKPVEKPKEKKIGNNAGKPGINSVFPCFQPGAPRWQQRPGKKLGKREF